MGPTCQPLGFNHPVFLFSHTSSEQGCTLLPWPPAGGPHWCAAHTAAYSRCHAMPTPSPTPAYQALSLRKQSPGSLKMSREIPPLPLSILHARTTKTKPSPPPRLIGAIYPLHHRILPTGPLELKSPSPLAPLLW
jgi:hypothetical protein